KEQSLEKSADRLRSREEALAGREQELASAVEEQKRALMRISDMTADQAREALLQRVEEESRHEMARVSRKIVEAAEEDAKRQATEILLNACQRFAAE